LGTRGIIIRAFLREGAVQHFHSAINNIFFDVWDAQTGYPSWNNKYRHRGVYNIKKPGLED